MLRTSHGPMEQSSVVQRANIRKRSASYTQIQLAEPLRCRYCYFTPSYLGSVCTAWVSLLLIRVLFLAPIRFLSRLVISSYLIFFYLMISHLSLHLISHLSASNITTLLATLYPLS